MVIRIIALAYWASSAAQLFAALGVWVTFTRRARVR
jgi:hypothetical protein